MKPCFKCGITKPLTEFYKHPKMLDGYVNKCKECNKIDVKENYAKNRVYYSEYDKKRFQIPERRKNKRKYDIKYRTTNSIKYKAHTKVQNAVRDGRLIRMPCSLCGNPESEAHHDDYTKPLEVKWMCFKCHREVGHNQVVTQC